MTRSLTVSSPYATKYLYPTRWDGRMDGGLIQMIPGPPKAKLSIYSHNGILHYILLAIFLNTLLYLFS
ncbi:hypothetical protein BCR42DRAFT_405347 [Absidia repens]|uniref:Uncharacterized protein n=1 Tax=Absidia repens TaxID=90262 RepID=A0A1X2ITC2_9FUNG|nr:hypothetical protein BCR42DRAFT_405347 [Absidia repens]